MKTTLFFSLLFSALTSWSQAPGIEWQNTIGGTLTDYLHAAEQTSDGGYILGGYSASDISGDKTENNIGSGDYWVVKLDASGNIEWQNTIGGNSSDLLSVIHQTLDGGYIIGGTSSSDASGDKSENSLGYFDYWVVRLNSLGVVEWENTIGGNETDFLNCLIQTPSGYYFAGGYSDSDISFDKTENSYGESDYWFVRISPTGVADLDRTIGGSESDALHSMQQTSDQGFILAGNSESGISGLKSENSYGYSDYWIVKLNIFLGIQWQNTIGGDSTEYLSCVEQTNDGGYILAGDSYSGISGVKTENSWGKSDYWVVKVDSVGNIQWQNTIGGNDDDLLHSIQQTSDGEYILGGTSSSNVSGDKTEINIGAEDFWILKLNPSGSIQWQNTIGGIQEDWSSSIDQTNDGGYFLGGFSESNISGDKTENAVGGFDYWVLKLYPDSATSVAEITNDNGIISIFPNPFTTTAIITINQPGLPAEASAQAGEFDFILYDVYGREVMQLAVSSAQSTISRGNLAAGVYFYTVKDNTKMIAPKESLGGSGKVVVE